ncbi:glucose 1-dehydrogenase [Candidatus Bathyarchaeota archaeon]|nr:glucose 1-dehydrogenase [Candidatus Bathyarchaeota archaeon]MBL7167857.1 glucose 1-dehydrogenase [Candidatus Bathyarchaeota archaeon]
MPGKLEGRVALITGGASGIGEATARLFVEEGAKVLVTDVQDERGQALTDALGPNAVYLHVDVSLEDDVEQAVRHANETFGRLDCMFNNAGIAGAVGPIEEVSVEAFDETIGVLLRGVFLGIKHAATVMKARGTGSIINTASVAGIRTGYGNHIYSAAKAGVIQLTRSTAMELGESGVRVNCICPGFIATPMIGRARGLSVEEADEKLDIVKESFKGAQPIRRTGLPEDIAKAVLWLASDDSGFVNGQALVVDGGVTGGRMWSDYQDAIDGLKRVLGQAG